MKKTRIVFLSLVLLWLVSLPAFAETVKYDFNEVEVIFAAEFTATPVSADVYNWFTDAAGGPEKPVNVLYGIVNLKSEMGSMQEEFIKVTGENGSERFLANSGSTEWYDPGIYSQVRSSYTQFWSGKKLIDNSVVKDFSQPLNIIYLHKYFDRNQRLTSIAISFSSQADKSNLSSDYSYYVADNASLNVFGNPFGKK